MPTSSPGTTSVIQSGPASRKSGASTTPRTSSPPPRDAGPCAAPPPDRPTAKTTAPTHCNNIGPEHRKHIYPTLNKWFGLPAPEAEYKKRFDSSELQCWTEEARKTLKPKMLHEILQKGRETKG